MAYRWHPKNAEVDSDNPRAWGTCDRCGRIWNLYRLAWQYDYNGAPTLQNLRVLVCETCYDTPQPQLSPLILGPDPEPIANARPEPYFIDENSVLATEDGDPLATEDDDVFIPAIPNPQSDPETF